MSCGADSPIVRKRMLGKQRAPAAYAAWRDRSVRSRRGESDASWSDVGDHGGQWSLSDYPGGEGQRPNEGRLVPLSGRGPVTRGLSVVRPRPTRRTGYLRSGDTTANGTSDPEDASAMVERRSRSAEPIRPALVRAWTPDRRGSGGAGSVGGGVPQTGYEPNEPNPGGPSISYGPDRDADPHAYLNLMMQQKVMQARVELPDTVIDRVAAMVGQDVSHLKEDMSKAVEELWRRTDILGAGLNASTLETRNMHDGTVLMEQGQQRLAHYMDQIYQRVNEDTQKLGQLSTTMDDNQRWIQTELTKELHKRNDEVAQIRREFEAVTLESATASRKWKEGVDVDTKRLDEEIGRLKWSVERHVAEKKGPG